MSETNLKLADYIDSKIYYDLWKFPRGIPFVNVKHFWQKVTKGEEKTCEPSCLKQYRKYIRYGHPHLKTAYPIEPTVDCLVNFTWLINTPKDFDEVASIFTIVLNDVYVKNKSVMDGSSFLYPKFNNKKLITSIVAHCYKYRLYRISSHFNKEYAYNSMCYNIEWACCLFADDRDNKELIDSFLSQLKINE